MKTVRFAGVSKVYRQRHQGAPDGDLWALRDVSLACEEGEMVGLVGRNGCGKSTLLKLAAGVTEATAGRVECAQPVAPMLELGAGFHPDLTGRDNIRLNGALLGLGWKISEEMIDRVVSFAGTEAHIDTPVKHYSSGMYARLGFSVAVHSPARVLLVDEVLSVGDTLFQKRCQEKMRELREKGTTILLVTHDTWWIRRFCTRAIVLEGGKVVADAEPGRALEVYERVLRGIAPEDGEGIQIRRVELRDGQGRAVESVADASLRVRVEYEVAERYGAWVMAVRMRRNDGVGCATCIGVPEWMAGAGRAEVEVGNLHLAPGQYCVEVSIEEAKTARPITMASSAPFFVYGEFDELRGYEGALQVKHDWQWEKG